MSDRRQLTLPQSDGYINDPFSEIPDEVLGRIFDYTGGLSNIRRVSRRFDQAFSGYQVDLIRSSLRRLDRGQSIQDSERELLLRYRETPDYDKFVLVTFNDRFFSLPIEFGLKQTEASTLDVIDPGLSLEERGLLRYHFRDRLVYNISKLEEIEPFLDRSLDVGVDTEQVHELNIFTHVDRVTDGPLYRNVVILNGMTIGEEFLVSCASLKSLTLPIGLTSIGGFFLSECTSLSTLTLPAGLTSIGGVFLSECTSLTSLNIPIGVTSIGDWFLWQCTSLTSLTLPAGMSSIGDSFLWNCTSLKSLNLPAGVISIGNYFLSGCTSLTSLTLLGRSVQVGPNFLINTLSLTHVKTPDGILTKNEFINTYKV